MGQHLVETESFEDGMLCRQIQTLFQLPKSSALTAQLHCLLLKVSLDRREYFITHLILSAVSFSNSLLYARKIFDTSHVSPLPLFAWNTLIKAYSKGSFSDSMESIRLFVQLLRLCDEPGPNKFTFPFVIKACGRCSMLRAGGSVHSMVIKAGFSLDSHVNNTLLTMYGDCHAVHFARRVFDEMRDRDLVSWSSMIAANVGCNLDLDGLRVFKEMATINVKPNFITFVSLVAACTKLLNIQLGKSIHSYLIVNGVEFHVGLGTALMNMYAKCGHLEEVFHIFNSIAEKNLQSWTIMISCLADYGCGEEAISLFTTMEGSGLTPDSMLFSAVLSACSHGGVLDKGQELFEKMVNVYNINPTMEHYGCMVDLYGRAGKTEEAYCIIKSMPMQPNPVILRSYLSACKHHGHALYVDKYFMQLLLKIEPDIGSNYVLVANVSSATGYWSDMDTVRHDMKRKGLKKVPGCSWV